MAASGVLTEEERRAYVEDAADLSVETPDDGFLTVAGVRAMFTENELNETVERVRSEVLDRLDEVIETEEDNYPRSESPDAYFSALRSALRGFRGEFERRGDARAVEKLDAAIVEIDEVVSRRDEDYHHPGGSSGMVAMHQQAVAPSSEDSDLGRSRFDDVDD